MSIRFNVEITNKHGEKIGVTNAASIDEAFKAVLKAQYEREIMVEEASGSGGPGGAEKTPSGGPTDQSLKDQTPPEAGGAGGTPQGGGAGYQAGNTNPNETNQTPGEGNPEGHPQAPVANEDIRVEE